jgi:hypothetical protein
MKLRNVKKISSWKLLAIAGYIVLYENINFVGVWTNFATDERIDLNTYKNLENSDWVKGKAILLQAWTGP